MTATVHTDPVPAAGLGLRVADITRTQLFRIPPTATIRDAARELVRRDVECLVVTVDGAERLVTARNVLQALLPSPDEAFSDERLAPPDELELEAIASEHAARPVTVVDMPLVPKVPEDTAAIRALAKLLATGQRRLLVVDAAGAVTGVLTQQDLVRNLFLVL